METLYRKVAVTKQDLIEYLRSQYEQKKEYDCMPENDEGYEYISDSSLGKIVDGLIPMVKNLIKTDNSHQIEKLEADKAELLEMLENCYRLFQKMSIYPITNKIESLIQKHKQ